MYKGKRDKIDEIFDGLYLNDEKDERRKNKLPGSSAQGVRVPNLSKMVESEAMRRDRKTSI